MSSAQVIGLFPVPVAKIDRLIGPELIAQVIAETKAAPREDNARSTSLSHTRVADPKTDPTLRRVHDLLMPRLIDFGALILGERIGWIVKEAWVNLLLPGGHQAIHNHANSFVSAVIYLTPSHPASRTVFHKPGSAGADVSFVNENRNTKLGPFNATKWVTPEMQPGDAVLFPSQLMHEVPPNPGAERMTIAMNALPERLDSWGYQVRFS